MDAPGAIQIHRKEDKNNLITWAGNEGGNKKQHDYTMVNGNSKTWLNYTKTKGAANIRKNFQRKILRCELRVKLRNKTNANISTQPADFNKNALRDAKEINNSTKWQRI